MFEIRIIVNREDTKDSILEVLERAEENGDISDAFNTHVYELPDRHDAPEEGYPVKAMGELYEFDAYGCSLTD